MDGNKVREDVIRFLKENSTAVVATSYKDDPKVSTVYFVSDDDLNFYFLTKRKTSKYLNASLNPKASFVVGTGPLHISVQSHGRIDIIVNDAEKERIVSLLVGKQNLLGVKLWPIDELQNYNDSNKVLFKIVPDELYYMNLDSEKHKDSISDEFIKVI
jgi:nitroimidazol reductase NimA-like FMN-containing flavoprotein (pyridoxamine 5'-phosphate oxidase superfamily)